MSTAETHHAGQADLPAEKFERDGFFIPPDPVIPKELVGRAVIGMDAVMNREYETGIPPGGRKWNPGDDERVIRKIDQPHICDRTIMELFTYPAIGQWAAHLTGAKMIQLWASQLLYKPSGGDVSGNVGWHQDKQYWTYWQEGEVFTAWIALSDVTEESGPMRFVRGSHAWGGLIEGGDFYGSDHQAQRETITVPPGKVWEEVPVVLPPGGVSFHHRHTFHGSGPNRASSPRRSFALHLRTENTASIPGIEKDVHTTMNLDDPSVCPILYQSVDS